MNTYEAKQEARRERLEAAAKTAATDAERLTERADRMASVIPLGQPVLIGHHSEGRDRRYRQRIHNTFQRAHEEHKRAEELQHRAEAVGRGGISADDPDALAKLQAKLAAMEKARETMKATNAKWRALGKPKADDAAAWQTIANAVGLDLDSLADARQTLAMPQWYGVPFPPYKLTNLGGRIKQAKVRIGQLEQTQAQATQEPTPDQTLGEWTIREDSADNRLLLISPNKPADEVRAALKSHGFKWSPTRGAWVRQLNDNARYYARTVLQSFVPAP